MHFDEFVSVNGYSNNRATLYSYDCTLALELSCDANIDVYEVISHAWINSYSTTFSYSKRAMGVSHTVGTLTGVQ